MSAHGLKGWVPFCLVLSLILIVSVQVSRHIAASSGNTQEPAPAFDQAKNLADLRHQLVGKERTPSEQVFKNIQDYKGIPAAGLLRGMEFYTRALGVDCTHCHVVDQWEKDDKPAKQIARDMARMVDTIQQSLKTIKNLKSERPGVSCATCHRGQLKPAISVTPPASQ
jgi:hypothetical protein